METENDRGGGAATLVLRKSRTRPGKRPDGAVTLFWDGAQVMAVLPDGTLAGLLPLTAQAYTTANIAAVAHAVNVTGKFAGKIVRDSTLNRYKQATGALAASPWVDLNGGNSVTPA